MISRKLFACAVVAIAACAGTSTNTPATTPDPLPPSLFDDDDDHPSAIPATETSSFTEPSTVTPPTEPDPPPTEPSIPTAAPANQPEVDRMAPP